MMEYHCKNLLLKVTKSKQITLNVILYIIKTKFEIQNKSNKSIKSTAYYQLVHDGLSNQGSAFMPTFTGPAFYTNKIHFDKFDFNDLDKKIEDTKKNDATFEKAAGVEGYKDGKKF